MMAGSVDELLIQRCVDNELSSLQRRKLLEQLERSPDAWKTLACTYMEEQLFSAAVVEEDQKVASQLVPKSPSPLDGRRHWFHHPLTSVALSGCIAFLLGVLVSGEMNRDGLQGVAAVSGSESTIASLVGAASSSDPAENVSHSPAGTLASNGGAGPAYHLQLESDGNMLKEVPVYADQSKYLFEYESVQQQFLSSLGNGVEAGPTSDPQVKFIRLPLADGRVIVVPIESFSFGPRFQ